MVKWINPSPCKQGSQGDFIKVDKYIQMWCTEFPVNNLKFPAQWNNSDPANFFCPENVCLLCLLHILKGIPEHFSHGRKHYEPRSD